MAPVMTARGIMLRLTQMEKTDQLVPVRSFSGMGMMCCCSKRTNDWVTTGPWSVWDTVSPLKEGQQNIDIRLLMVMVVGVRKNGPVMRRNDRPAVWSLRLRCLS